MNKKFYVLFGILVILSLTLTACGRSTSGNTGNAGNAQPGSANTGGDALPVAVDVEDKWPEDVPLPEDAFDIDVARGATQLNFKLPGDIDATMAYLQEQLPAYGWETEVTPDSAVGAMATMLRENAEGHRMSINIQYNQLGDFVTITLAIVREGN
jgi:hypothetical protein